jgi:hypothetical protein
LQLTCNKVVDVHLLAHQANALFKLTPEFMINGRSLTAMWIELEDRIVSCRKIANAAAGAYLFHCTTDA